MTPYRCEKPRRRRYALLFAAAALALLQGCATVSTTADRAPARNVAAFAKLYGVVRYFYPGDAARTIDWERFAVAGVAQASASKSSDELLRTLRTLFAPIAPHVQILAIEDAFAEGTPDRGEQRVAWLHRGLGVDVYRQPEATYLSLRIGRAPPDDAAAQARDLIERFPQAVAAATQPDRVAAFELGQGLKARVPLSLSATEAATPEDAEAVDALRERLRATDLDASLTAVRAADVVVIWNVLRHFYPYWQETRVDWDAVLEPAIAEAFTDGERAAHKKTLKRLVARIVDGHGQVDDTVLRGRRGWLPIGVAPAGGDFVVNASGIPERVAVGDVVRRIDGIDAHRWFADTQAKISGSAQWKAWMAADTFATGEENASVTLQLDGVHGEHEVVLAFDRPSPAAEKRPPPIAEIASGVWYVDLERASMSDVTPKLTALAQAKATIFDLRGYPTDAGFGVLPHLIDAPERDRWMRTPIRIAPYDEPVAFERYGWDLDPKPPHFAGRRYVLQDGRALSYAESVLGYFTDLKLATTIGAASAGANGNVNMFTTPGGFTVRFTGMRVTRHDGIGSLHGIGIAPDIAVEQTAQAWRDGRDLALERTLAFEARAER